MMTLNLSRNQSVLALALGMVSVVGVASAQDAPNRGWRKVTDPAPVEQGQPADQGQAADQTRVPNPNQPVAEGPEQPPLFTNQAQAYPQGPAYPSSFPPAVQPAGNVGNGQQQYPYPPPGYQSAPGSQSAGSYQRPAAPVPAQLTLRPGTFVTVRVNNPISSDRNQQGDAFTATLIKPIVVDGVVVAQAGQTIAGRVSEAQKAGRVSGTSKLGLQLTELTLVDGTQVPVQSDLMTRNGRTTVGNDVGAVGATTAVGAAIGAAADWGRGAAIGAGAGAAAGILGVLLTRGQPTVVYPETQLTFRVTAPVTIATDRAPQAFRYADAGDYQHSLQSRQGPPARVAYGPGGIAPYYSPYPYYYGPSYVYGPSFGVYVGPRYRYYGRRW